MKFYLVAILCLVFTMTNCKKDDDLDADDNKKPLIAFLTPESDISVPRGTYINLKIEVDDPDGLIKEVLYTVNGEPLTLIKKEAPYDYSWDTRNFPPDQYRLVAAAKDNDGGISTTELLVTIFHVTAEIETLPITNIGPVAATSGIRIITEGVPAAIEAGICWSKNPNPTPDDFKIITKGGNINYNEEPERVLTNLELGTRYYARAYYKNSETIVYGEEFMFKTRKDFWSDKGTFIDSRDGTRYKWVTIGDQTWMAENLKHNLDIPGAWAVYDYNGFFPGATGSYEEAILEENYNIYGALYSYEYAVSDVLCPDGWHMPNSREWYQLVNFLGGSEFAPEHMIEQGTIHWNEPNDAKNSSLFTALPSGSFFESGYDFSGINRFGGYWANGLRFYISYKDASVSIPDKFTLSFERDYYMACRCVKDD